MLVQNGDAHPIVPIESVKTQQIQVGSCGPYGPFKPPLSNSLSFSSFWCQPLIAALPKRFKRIYITFFVLPNLFQPSLASTTNVGKQLVVGHGLIIAVGFFPVEKQLRVFSMRIFFSRKCLERDKTSTRNFSEFLTVELHMEKTTKNIG